MRALPALTRRTLELLTGRWLWAVAALDGVLLLMGLLGMLLMGMEATAFFGELVLTPLLMLAPAILAGTVAVERESGSLDLALAVPSVERYFLLRVVLVVGLFAVQSWALVLLFWIKEGLSFPLLPALLHALLVCAVVGAASLFWAVRLASRGAVWGATLVTALLLGRWLGYNPVPARLTGEGGRWWPALENVTEWAISAAVLATATVLFLLYTRRRLRRPETLWMR
jgi:hypothetical protein